MNGRWGCGTPLDETTVAADHDHDAGILGWDLCPSCAAAVATLAGEAALPPDPAAFARHPTAAHGFLELGMPLEAWNELEAIGPPRRRAGVAGLELRMAIFQALEKRGTNIRSQPGSSRRDGPLAPGAGSLGRAYSP